MLLQKFFARNVMNYFFAIALVALATLARLELQPYLGSEARHVVFVVAIIVTAIFAGFGAGFFATILSALSIHYFFFEVYGSFASEPIVIVRGLLFVVIGGAISAICGALRSTLSNQQKILAQQKESETRTRLVSQATNNAVWNWDFSSNKVDWSESFFSVFGYEPYEVKGDINWWYGKIHIEDRERILTSIHQIIDSGQTMWSDEYRFLKKDRSYAYVFDRAYILQDEKGQPLRMIGAMQDITQTKRAMEDLKKAKAAAESANRAKNQFLANMSHEIRTPMNAILGFSEALQDQELDRKKQEELLYRIRSNGKQLLHLIDDILDLSRVESGVVKVESNKFSLPDLISDVFNTLGPLARKKGIDLRLNLQTSIPDVIQSDAVRLKQILLHLLSNAIKFTKEGHVELKIRLFKNLRSPKLEFEIEDSGIGISNEDQARLFKPFSQADSSITRSHSGTGLGLLLSKRLVEALNGKIYLKRSELGRGTIFVFSIDPGDITSSFFVNQVEGINDEAKVIVLKKAEDKGDLKDLNILLAEDSKDNETLVKIFLEPEGLNIDVAHDGLEAVNLARKKNYDLILMDIQMPHLDGLEATRQLRANKYDKPILALTAHALREEVQKSIEAGCNAHITKPIHKNTLIEAIREYLPERKHA